MIYDDRTKGDENMQIRKGNDIKKPPKTRRLDLVKQVEIR